MGTQISDVISVSITKEAARLSRAGFGIPCLINDNYKQYERTVLYTDPADMLTTNGGPYSTTDELYIAALNLMGQSVSPTQFYIGRKYDTTNALYTQTCNISATGGTFTLDVYADGSNIGTTAAIDFDDPDTGVGSIEEKIEAIVGVTAVTVTFQGAAAQAGDADGFTVEFTGADAASDFYIVVNTNSLTAASTVTITGTMTQYGSTAETWVTCYAAAKAYNNLWYEFDPIERVVTATEAEFTALAAAVEADMKTCCLISADSVIPTTATTDIASDLAALNYDRTCVIYSTDTSSWANAAWAGRCLPANPGSITWNWKQLVGVVAEDLTAAEVANMKSKNCNFVEEVGSLTLISSGGVMASGEYRDIIRGIDLLTARMSEDLFVLEANSDKIDFDVSGTTAVEGEMRGSLITYGVGYRIITEDSIVVNVPAIDDIPTSEKAARWLNNVTWSATLKGAIHTMTIRGKVVV